MGAVGESMSAWNFSVTRKRQIKGHLQPQRVPCLTKNSLRQDRSRHGRWPMYQLTMDLTNFYAIDVPSTTFSEST